jgi:DNA-binding MarR family transcriptional regulator
VTGHQAARVDEARAAIALRRVIDEVRALFHRLGDAADRLHREDRLPASQRAVLMELAQHGPRTVPAMARARPVSRQHIQTIVNALGRRGLVELADNPRHRRSKLVRITDAGRTIAARVRRREGQILTALSRQLDADDLTRTLATLAAIERLLQDERANTEESDDDRT